MNAAEKTFLGSTNWTERVGPTAALAMIDKHKSENVSDKLHILGKKYRKVGKKIASETGLNISVSGIYPMSSFSFNEKDPLKLRAYFVQEMLKENILAGSQFYAMYSHTEKNVDRYLNVVQNIFYKLKKVIEKGSIDKELIGEPAVAGFKRLN